MGDKTAIVYSAEWCPWCHKAIDFLKENGVVVEVRDVAQNPDYAKEVQEKTGQSGIPVILIGDEVVIGFNQAKLKEILGLDKEKKEDTKSEEKKKESDEKKEEPKDDKKGADSSYA